MADEKKKSGLFSSGDMVVRPGSEQSGNWNRSFTRGGEKPEHHDPIVRKELFASESEDEK
jgi:hypothetical protein